MEDPGCLESLDMEALGRNLPCLKQNLLAMQLPWLEAKAELKSKEPGTPGQWPSTAVKGPSEVKAGPEPTDEVDRLQTENAELQTEIAELRRQQRDPPPPTQAINSLTADGCRADAARAEKRPREAAEEAHHSKSPRTEEEGCERLRAKPTLAKVNGIVVKLEQVSSQRAPNLYILVLLLAKY